MLWLFVALQAMAPFIHAHAGVMQVEHAGFMHLHQGAEGDVAWHGAASGEHGTEVAVAAGVPLRHTVAVAHMDQASIAAPTARRIDDSAQRLAHPRAPPAPRVALRAHARPPALAPPAR